MSWNSLLLVSTHEQAFASVLCWTVMGWHCVKWGSEKSNLLSSSIPVYSGILIVLSLNKQPYSSHWWGRRDSVVARWTVVRRVEWSNQLWHASFKTLYHSPRWPLTIEGIHNAIQWRKTPHFISCYVHHDADRVMSISQYAREVCVSIPRDLDTFITGYVHNIRPCPLVSCPHPKLWTFVHGLGRREMTIYVSFFHGSNLQPMSQYLIYPVLRVCQHRSRLSYLLYLVLLPNLLDSAACKVLHRFVEGLISTSNTTCTWMTLLSSISISKFK